MSRTEDLNRLYRLLDHLERNVGGTQQLKDCDGYMDWPDRGIYFFFAPDERRAHSDALRLTRVGTHAVSAGSGKLPVESPPNAQGRAERHLRGWGQSPGLGLS